MPIYEYRCESCGKRTEALQKLKDPPLKKCPECGGRLRKLVSAPSFQFKGSGWYATDYAAKKGGGDGDGATDTKPSETTASDAAASADGAKKPEAKPDGEKAAKESKASKAAKPAAASKERGGGAGKPTSAAS